MPQESPSEPIFWIVAGPNGSGKSSLYEKTNIQQFGRSVWIINPDRLAARICLVEAMNSTAANLEAVKRIEGWLEASIATHQTIGVETVLSTDKYRRLVLAARARRIEVRLLYVVLDSPDRNVERVKLRVARGGHDVPETKIRERYYRSLAQLPWFLSRSDKAWIFDNSGAEPKLIGEKIKQTITLDPAALPEIVEAARAIRGS